MVNIVTIKELEKILKVLANKRRLAIVALLKKGDKKTVGEVADEIKLSFAATSRNLRILAAVDLVDCEQVAAEVHYFLSRELSTVVRDIIKYL